MTIGKYCQICGEKKKKSEVITEAYGIVITAPCMMTKVFGDPPAAPEEAKKMASYCAVCGAENEKPLSGNCRSCNNPLTASDGDRKLADKGETPPFGKRITAFFIDLAIIVALAIVAVWAVGLVEQSYTPTTEVVSGEGEGMNFFTFLRIFAVAMVFILYHATFTWAMNATPGKVIMGLKVMLKNGGDRMDFARAFVRSALYLFSLYVIPIGLLPLLFQEDPKTWMKLIEEDAMYHNSLTDTVVIKPKM